MKQKIIVIGITMAAAGTERALLSFLSEIDSEKYDVELLLAKKEGAFMSEVPEWVHVSEMSGRAGIFLINKNNAKNVIFKSFILRNPLYAFVFLPYIIKIALCPNKRDYIKNRLWLRMMKTLPEHKGEYDIALAFWGDHTVFYAVDKINAKKKIAWMHFDYSSLPRENRLYEYYFGKCDRLVAVSEDVKRSVISQLPGVAGKVTVFENPLNKGAITSLSEEGNAYNDGFDGFRIFTAGRLAPQKGYDIAIPAVAELIKEGYKLRWYIAGEGESRKELENLIDKLGVKDDVVLLGSVRNPYKYMKGCDIYFQPSRFEGKPISVEEAKFLKKPLVVTAYGSASEQLYGGKYGIITDISEEGIYRGLKKMLDRNVLNKYENEYKSDGRVIKGGAEAQDILSF